MKAYPFTSTTAATMRQNCGGSLMFNMYLSGTVFFVRKMRNIAEKNRETLRVCVRVLRAPPPVSLTSPSGTRVLFCRKSDILFPGRVS